MELIFEFPAIVSVLHQQGSRFGFSINKTILDKSKIMSLRKYELYFFTATNLEWKFVLANKKYKDIIIESLAFLVHNKRALVHGFVIMDNHIHILWHINAPNKKEDVQRDFLRFTSQQIIKQLRNENSPLLEDLRVNAKDRKYQVWERNALWVDVYSEPVLVQKLRYIHENPVRAGLCLSPTDYYYSSALYYEDGNSDFDFLSHYRWGD